VGSGGQDRRWKRGENHEMEQGGRNDAGIVHIGSQTVEAV